VTPAAEPAARRPVDLTLRSEGQFNTVVYENEDIYRGIDRRDVVMMNADDAAALGLEHDDAAWRPRWARWRYRLRLLDVARGSCVMYYPGQHRPPALDPRSGTRLQERTLPGDEDVARGQRRIMRRGLSRHERVLALTRAGAAGTPVVLRPVAIGFQRVQTRLCRYADRVQTPVAGRRSAGRVAASPRQPRRILRPSP
jgi:hypothetical protein